MQSKSGDIHVVNRVCCIQGYQQHSQPLRVVGLNSGGTSRFKELPQTFVPKRLDHLAADDSVLRITQQAWP